MSVASSIVLTMLVPLAACASQVDGDHQGTTLATLHGNVSSSRSTTPAGADVAVIWRNWSGPSLIGGGIEPVEGNFPAEFSLSMYEPPPANMINVYEGVEFAVAFIEAVEPGQTEFLWPAPQALGMDFDHLLVYVPADVPAGSFVSKLLHSTPAAGFHLYGVRRLTAAEVAARQACIDALGDFPPTPSLYDQCGGRTDLDDLVPLPADLATPLEVEMIDDLASSDFPIWT